MGAIHDEVFVTAKILQRLKQGPCLAKDLAEITGLSERHVYRFIKRIKAAGVKIKGEAGVGYAWMGEKMPPSVPELSYAMLRLQIAIGKYGAKSAFVLGLDKRDFNDVRPPLMMDRDIGRVVHDADIRGDHLKINGIAIVPINLENM